MRTTSERDVYGAVADAANDDVMAHEMAERTAGGRGHDAIDQVWACSIADHEALVALASGLDGQVVRAATLTRSCCRKKRNPRRLVLTASFLYPPNVDSARGLLRYKVIAPATSTATLSLKGRDPKSSIWLQRGI